VTVQPWWVQVAENATNFPAVGWEITMPASVKTLPLPTGMSAVAASVPVPFASSVPVPDGAAPTVGTFGSSLGAARPVM
jgi:hypothetical protein